MSGNVDLSRFGDGMHRVAWADRPAVVKVRRDARPDFFAAEARGLGTLHHAGAMRVPEVFAVGPAYIVIEDLGEGRPSSRDWENAGRGLACLHRSRAQRFGFDADGYCGDTPQANGWGDDGVQFFVEQRLLPLARRAFAGNRLDRADVARIETLATRFHDLFPAAPPVLIHGDLWTGNLHACANGELALIDGGAVHYGWAECDLAMLILFGEPPRAFFAAYQDEARIDASWRARAPLLNLYHLLNHLTLFGSGYLGSVRSVLARYA